VRLCYDDLASLLGFPAFVVLTGSTLEQALAPAKAQLRCRILSRWRNGLVEVLINGIAVEGPDHGVAVGDRIDLSPMIVGAVCCS